MNVLVRNIHAGFLSRVFGSMAVVLGVVFSSPLQSIGDIVTLKDGTTLRCKVIEQTQPLANGNKYQEIRIGQSVILINRDAIERIETTPDADAVNPEIEELIKRLMQEGILVPSVNEKVDIVKPPDVPREQEITIQSREIRGWAYVYENEKALEDGKRLPILAGDAVPLGSILKVSPNTRMTLDLPSIGEMGLEAGTEIRIDELSKNRSRRNFSMSFHIDTGRCWLNIRSKERLILTVNSVRSIPRDALFYIETMGKTGAIDITYLKGDNDLKFSRNRVSEAPYMVNQGQILHVDPGVNRLPIEESPVSSILQRRIETWNNWQPDRLMAELESVVPPLETFPSFRALPALHPYKLLIDQSLIMQAETQSLGEILSLYRQAVERYRLDTGHYPSFDQGLEALTKSFDVPGWKGPYLPQNLTRRDAWGNPFVYDLYTDNGKQYADVRSNGQNGKDDKGLGDDIR